MDDLDEIIKEFLEESNENLDRLDNELVVLETNPTDREILGSIFRTIHSIKGTCGFLGFGKLEKVTHAGENLLSRLRDGEILLNPERTSALLAMVDAVRQMLAIIETTGNDGDEDYSALIETLTLLQHQKAQPSAATSKSSAAEKDFQAVSPVQDPEANDEVEEIVRDFLAESNENLDRLDNELIALETDPTNRDILASIFRTIHSIKGTCGFLGFDKLEKVTHAGENLLSLLRDGKILLNPERTSALLAMVDAVRQMLIAIETTGRDGNELYRSLTDTLTRLQEDGASNTASKAASNLYFGEVLVKNNQVSREQLESALELQDRGDPRHIGEILVAEKAVPPTAVVEALKTQKESRTPSLGESSIRVDVGLLDKLMNLVGELVLTRNQIQQHAKVHEDAQFVAASQQLDLITGELQEGVMKTRMQPINNIWNKIPRIVRDLALSCGKQIRVEMEGKDTELDKSLIEAMKDPLTHLVRNCVDHGIESPEVRTARGKPAEGCLTLRAYHEGGQVNIEIADDGAGIPAEKLKAKALQKGLITAEQAAEMSDREITNLIFLPGFSTAEKVTNISGRGVGMDVVKTNIEKIGGAIELHTTPHVGTTFKINLPLTLAIVPALIVASDGHRFAIPQGSLQELIRLNDTQANGGIEYLYRAPVYRLRGKLLPLIYLSEELQLPTSRPDGAANIVVLQVDKRRFGLVVDQISDTQEIVVKPLSKFLHDIPVFAGATVMGDGKVVLILDILGLAQRSRIVSESCNQAMKSIAQDEVDYAEERQKLLIVRSPGDGRLAIPLAKVARLEEIPMTAVEWAGDRALAQYRDQILPLIRLTDVLAERRRWPLRDVSAIQETDADLLHVVVYTVNGRSLGLVVEQIIDIVEESLSVRGAPSRDGILGTAVIEGKVTELFDVEGFLERTLPIQFPESMAKKRA